MKSTGTKMACGSARTRKRELRSAIHKAIAQSANPKLNMKFRNPRRKAVL